MPGFPRGVSNAVCAQWFTADHHKVRAQKYCPLWEGLPVLA